MALAQAQIETERLDALRRLAIFRSERQPEFDAVVSNVAHLLNCPMSVVSIVHEEDIWFKATFGLGATEVPRENSFCGQTILSDDVVIVPDATKDERFKDIPLVTGDFGARFYLGCPVKVDGKHRIATICVMDTKPHPVSESDVEHIKNAARVVEGLVKARKTEIDLREALSRSQNDRREDTPSDTDRPEFLARTTLETSRDGILFLDPSGHIRSFNPAAASLLECPEASLVEARVQDLQHGLEDIISADGSMANPLALAVSDPDSIRDREVRATGSANGQDKWLRLGVKAVREANRSAHDGVVLSLTDITSDKQQTETLQAFFDNFPGGLVHYNSQLQLTYWNEEFERLLNMPRSFLEQRPNLKEVIRFLADRGDYGPGDPGEIAADRLDRYGAGSQHAYERRTREGKVLEIRGTPLPGGGNVSSFLDITARKEMEGMLVDKEKFVRSRLDELEAIIANMRQGVSVFDDQGRIKLWNRHFLELFGRADGEIKRGMSLVEVLELEKQRGEFNEDPVAFDATLRRQLDAGEVVKAKFKHINGRIIGIVRTPLPDGGWVGTYEDITSREMATERITYAAHHDTLTGLANRTLFNLKLEDAITRAVHFGETSDLLMIDLDHFKPVNDTYGHDAGDTLLRLAGARLKECVRSKDTVARLGGDEFAIIARNLSEEQELVCAIAKRIVEALMMPYEINGNMIEVSASVGITAISATEKSANEILKKADIALYAVKNEGRNGFRHFDDLPPGT
ncbi:MAG: PAS-domain containing protein [Roseibium sp.]|uniref:sensor domain-containing diguanylate cyclase n=1 Tax=Roseibium sp. TaxID=1936156 RepID=UPI003D9BFFF8